MQLPQCIYMQEVETYNEPNRDTKYPHNQDSSF